MSFELVSNMGCNLGCSYCYEKHYNKYIDLEKSEKLIDELIKHHNKDKKLIIPIAGGEPFLEIDSLTHLINFLIRKIKENEINSYLFSLITNGTLLHKRKSIEFINKFHDAIRLSISFDGVKESQDSNRVTKSGKSTFDQVYNNIILMQNLIGKDKIGLNLVVNDNNIPYLSRSLKLLCHLEPWRIKINFAVESISENYVYEMCYQLMDFVDYYLKNNFSVRIYHLFDEKINDDIGPIGNLNTNTDLVKRLCIGSDLNMVGLDGKNYLCLRYHNLGIDKNQLLDIMKGVKLNKDIYPESCRSCHLFNDCNNCMAIPFENGVNTLEGLREYYKEKHNCKVTKPLNLVRTYILSKLSERNKFNV